MNQHELLSEFEKPINFKHSQALFDYYSYKSVQLGNLHKMRIYRFRELMNELIKSGEITQFDAALDVGCNTGLYSRIISDFGFKAVTGIDIVPEYVEKANRSFAFSDGQKSLEYRVENAEEIDTAKQYDFILCTEVIEHTNNQAKTIENLNKILKPGGVAVITLPNVVSFPYILTWISYKLQGRAFNAEMRDHLSYPFYKSVRLFKNKPYALIRTTGTNLYYWHFLHKYPGFSILNKFNYVLGKIWPFKFFTQFFFLVLKRNKNQI